jgi:thioester reductase-like protein
MREVHQVGCLVRASNAETGLQRIKSAMMKYGQWEERFADKIMVLCGSLEDIYLGLGPERFHEIAKWASVIFHLGARVNYTQPYSLHRPANVIGTRNILRLACAGRNKALHYVSSISCFGPTGFVTGTQTITEDEPILKHVLALPYDHGYAQSQWVVEGLLRRAMDRNFPVAIYRPGFITGHSRTGACNPDDFFCRLIHSCAEMGYYPLLPNQRKEFVPVDYVNATILHIAGLPAGSSLGHAYHIVPPSRAVSVDMNHTMELVGAASGGSGGVKGIPYSEWVELLGEKLPGRLQPLQPMLAEKAHGALTRWELYENMPLYDTTNTARALETYAGGLRFPILDRTLMEKYIRCLHASGSIFV